MMIDRVIAILGLIGFGAFLAVAVVFVKEFDLFMILGFTFFLACFDFYRTLFLKNAKENGGS